MSGECNPRGTLPRNDGKQAGGHGALFFSLRRALLSVCTLTGTGGYNFLVRASHLLRKAGTAGWPGHATRPLRLQQLQLSPAVRLTNEPFFSRPFPELRLRLPLFALASLGRPGRNLIRAQVRT